MGFVVTLDGPAGAGKSSVARQLAKRLGIRYLDTGAIYRAIAHTLDKQGIPPVEGEKLRKNLAVLDVRIEEAGVFVNGEDVSASIRTHRVDRIVSSYAALKSVRAALLGLQRDQAKYGALITDGRDTGTVVFPGADIKFFLTASPEARAERRYKELVKKGEAVIFREVLAQIHERDRADRTRETAPLKEPEGALYVDTSCMTESEVVNQLMFIIRRAQGGG
ncbi:MAG: (d)CMP kinase [Synergistaceae bacterium]|jgi:cytidylate kinase|nr:(d)CMP kinase [Synergistaceae bacterium]